MKNRRNYYRLLKVQPDAPLEIIRASYRTLMRELKQHPDLGGSAEMAAMLNEAYEVLSDPVRREEYNRQLSIRFDRQASASSARAKPGPHPPSCPFCARKLARKARPGECCPTCESPLESQEMASLDDASRRSVARMKRNGKILYYTAWPQKGRAGRLVDLSPKGMRFVCGEMIRQGAIVKISAPPLEATATVANMRRESDPKQGLYSIGVSFLAVNFGNSRGTFVSTCA